MMNPHSSNPRPWPLVEASAEGVMRFATAMPSARPRVENIREMEIGEMPTFTDALQWYERESGMELRGLECAMAMAGATSGEMLSMVRSRWTITRTGLTAVFGRPVTILNDVAARAWATRSGTASIETVRGAGTLSLDRYMMIMVEEGVERLLSTSTATATSGSSRPRLGIWISRPATSAKPSSPTPCAKPARSSAGNGS